MNNNKLVGKLGIIQDEHTHGVEWVFNENIQAASNIFAGINTIDQGDFLTIINPKTKEKVWSGTIKYDTTSNVKRNKLSGTYMQTSGRVWACWLQADVEPTDWEEWFLSNYAAELTKAAPEDVDVSDMLFRKKKV